MMKTKVKKGFTIIELIFSLTIFITISISLSGLISHVTHRLSAFSDKHEAFLNLTIAMDFLEVHIRNASALRVSNFIGTNDFSSLDLVFEDETETSIFYIKDTEYGKLYYNGKANEICRNIDKITGYINKEKEYIYLSIEARANDENFKVERYIDIEGKNIF